MSDTHDVEYEDYEESWTGRIAIAAVIALALIAGAFLAGRALAGSSGPATLAEAVQQAQAGDLPCGESAAPAGSPAPDAGGRFGVQAICEGGNGQQPPDGAQGRGRLGLGQTGEVTAIDADSLTLQGPMGDTTVKLDGATTINRSAKGELTDIKPGYSVLVAGAGPNGQGAATSVTVLPAGGN